MPEQDQAAIRVLLDAVTVKNQVAGARVAKQPVAVAPPVKVAAKARRAQAGSARRWACNCSRPRPSRCASPPCAARASAICDLRRGTRGTRRGAIMAANLLSNPRAIEVSVYVVRAFVRMRELAATPDDLAKRLAELEDKTEALAVNHDTFSRNTRNQLKQVVAALRELMAPPDPPKRPIGFISPEDKGSKNSDQARQVSVTRG